MARKNVLRASDVILSLTFVAFTSSLVFNSKRKDYIQQDLFLSFNVLFHASILSSTLHGID